MTLCEYVMDIAEEKAQDYYNSLVTELMCKIADEIIATAEEYEPQTED